MNAARSKQRCDVIVAGGGPVGCAAALLAARAGLDVVLVDPRGAPGKQELADVGLRVSALSAASEALLRELDAWLPRALRASPYHRMQVWEDRPEHAIEFDAEQLGEPWLGHIVPNGCLRHQLWLALADEPRVRVIESALTGLESRAERVDVLLDDGPEIRARLLLAADGARSPVRELLDIAVKVADYQQHALVAHLQLADTHEDTARQRFVQGQPIGMLPLLDQQLSVVWSTDPQTAEQLLSMDENGFRLRFQDALGDAAPAVSQVLARGRFPLKRVVAQRFVAPRVALLGDAANSVHPLAGQGLNLGFADADCLGELLADAVSHGRDIGSMALLRRYERRRRAERASLDLGIHGLQRLFASRLPGMVAVRSLGLSLVDRLSPLKRAFVRQAMGR